MSSYRRRKAAAAPGAPRARFIKAAYAGKCAEKGTPFAKGADVLYSNGVCFCENSQTYQDFLSAEIDRVYFGSNA